MLTVIHHDNPYMDDTIIRSIVCLLFAEYEVCVYAPCIWLKFCLTCNHSVHTLKNKVCGVTLFCVQCTLLVWLFDCFYE